MQTCSPNWRLRLMDLRAFTIWAFIAEGLSSVSRPTPSRSFRRYGTSSTLRACTTQLQIINKYLEQSYILQWMLSPQEMGINWFKTCSKFTWATSSVCSFWNIRLRASQAKPAMSGRHFIPVMRGPMVSREAMERTHSYVKKKQKSNVELSIKTRQKNSNQLTWTLSHWQMSGRRTGWFLSHLMCLLTSFSDSTCRRRMELLGTALFLWFSAARTRGRWPRGGTWSANWPCVLKRHTAAVVTVSRASPCRKPRVVRQRGKTATCTFVSKLTTHSHWGCSSPEAL